MIWRLARDDLSGPHARYTHSFRCLPSSPLGVSAEQDQFYLVNIITDDGQRMTGVTFHQQRKWVFPHCKPIKNDLTIIKPRTNSFNTYWNDFEVGNGHPRF